MTAKKQMEIRLKAIADGAISDLIEGEKSRLESAKSTIERHRDTMLETLHSIEEIAKNVPNQDQIVFIKTIELQGNHHYSDPSIGINLTSEWPTGSMVTITTRLPEKGLIDNRVQREFKTPTAKKVRVMIVVYDIPDDEKK